MSEEAITFVIDGRTYHLRSTDIEAIAAIPEADRRRLVSLLEAVKHQERRADSALRQLAGGPQTPGRGSRAAAPVVDPLDPKLVKSGRLGSGDIDNLVARLALEERQGRKPVPTRQGVYKWGLGLAALVILLVLFL